MACRKRRLKYPAWERRSFCSFSPLCFFLKAGFLGFAGAVCFRVSAVWGRPSGSIFGRGRFPYLGSPWVVAGDCLFVVELGLWVYGWLWAGFQCGVLRRGFRFSFVIPRPIGIIFRGKAYGCLGPSIGSKWTRHL